jgi:hypothetical protein
MNDVTLQAPRKYECWIDDSMQLATTLKDMREGVGYLPIGLC